MTRILNTVTALPPDAKIAGTVDDREVIGAMSGDTQALQALWERNRRWVAAILLAHKPSFEDLDDLLQDVAMTFVTRVNTVRDPRSFRSWLRIVAINTARAAGRSGRNRPRPDSEIIRYREEHGPTGGSPRHDTHAAPGESERIRTLLDLVHTLPEEYREPLLLRTVRGMRSKQVGELLGISPATVDTRVARARTMLRRARASLDPVEAGDSPVDLDENDRMTPPGTSPARTNEG